MNPEDERLLRLMTHPEPLLIAVAESSTAGHLQALLGATPGLSKVLEGGITAYNLGQKLRHLSINRDHAEACNCVSPRVADEMAQGACELFDTPLGAATTGYAEAEPARGATQPQTYWALCHRRSQEDAVIVRRGRCDHPAGTPRPEVQRDVARKVLSELIAYVEEFRSSRVANGRAAA